LREVVVGLKYAPAAAPLNFSAGVYQGAPEDLESLLHQADTRLYQAKHQGRGRTVSH
jgi:PleD family two-component response regulator